MLFIESNRIFDGDGNKMEDTYGTGGSLVKQAGPEIVARPTDIGLQWRSRGGTQEGIGMLRRPKVVLESALRES